MEQEVAEWLARAKRELETCRKNLEIHEYHVVVSRAYYAMFYAATAALLSRGIERKKHSGVISAFGAEFVKTGVFDRETFRLLPGAGDDRVEADYDRLPEMDYVLATQRLDDAEQFVDAVAALLAAS